MANEQLIKAAVEWAENGIPVFPCGGRKQPLTERGFYDAEKDPAKVRALFEFYGNQVKMIGGRMGDGLFAVDIDLYKGEDVKAWYKARLEDGSLVETRTHKTASGGLHLLYEADEAPTCVPIRGVEVKGEGSYIILPGTPGYETIQRGVSDATPSLLELIRYSVSNQRGSTIAQLEANILSGADFHNSLTQLAAKLAARGSDQVAIQSRLLDLLESSTAKTPGHDRHARWLAVRADTNGELSRIASSAYRKFNDEAIMEEAGETAQAGDLDLLKEVANRVFTQLGNFEPATAPIEFPTNKWPFEGQGYWLNEEHDLMDQKFTMFPIYAENETVVMFAEPKTGKTALSLTTALHIACGFDLGSFKVTEAGPVLYYALEGTRAIRLRVAAWKQKMREQDRQLPPSPPLFVVERGNNFLKEQQRNAAAQQIISADRYQKAQSGVGLKAIFIDTLTKAMSGGDQNSVEDTSALFDIVSLVRAGGVTATIIFVHHKARSGGLRGSSNIEAEPDVLLDVGKKNDVVMMRIASARSIEDGAQFSFLLSGVDLGITKQGHKQTGVFVQPLEETSEIKMVDHAEAQLIGQRRKMITELGSVAGSATADEVIDAWFLNGLIKGKSMRGKEMAPSALLPEVQEVLHKVAADAGGTVYGDYLIRPVIKDGRVTAFKVAEAQFSS